MTGCFRAVCYRAQSGWQSGSWEFRPPDGCSVSDTSLSSALSVRSNSSYYPRSFLIFGRFSESCDFFPFGVSMPSLRPFSESLISIASRR
jgi:hypothetical protein